MATYRVGDRVKVVAIAEAAVGEGYLIGKTGTIIGRGEHLIYTWTVRMDDGVPLADGTPRAAFNSEHLAPLTPPAEDTWAADKVKQVTKPLHIEPIAPKPLIVFGWGRPLPPPQRWKIVY